ncbi:MAG: hypothetical protein K0R49_66 [Burkholderiales bacterium]|jgi:hypothetical protein|nr:hypothetical protein [Burkholderiales bacterium]
MPANYLQPRYLTIDDVKPYLEGKVTFALGDNQGVSDELLGELIAFGESALERDFSPYFKVPLQTKTGENWQYLPASTLAIIKKCLINRACLQALRMSFGSNTNVRGDNYEDKYEVEYAALKSTLFQQKPNGIFLFPPTEGLALANNGINYSNILPGGKNVPLGGGNVPSALSYARTRLNNPGRSFWYFYASKK